MNTNLRLATGAALLALSGAASAVDFNFTFVAGTSAQAQAAFIAAGARWSALFTDNVTIDLTVGTAALGSGILASTGSRQDFFSYSSFYSALSADKTSAFDNTAVGSLGSGSSFGLLINRTSDNPNGSGSATPYLDTTGANNSTIRITSANAKALGLAAGSGTVGACASSCDGSVVFSTAFAFDFDPSNGISAGQYDFVGIATHEIGHALGFISGVDVLDANSPPVNGPFSADQFTFVSALDLFRYSALSDAAGVIDFTADNRAKYFSIDGGATVGPTFSNGLNFGDGRQASHWKDSLGLGIMDPTAATGELLGIGANDIKAFDVIGWNVAVAAAVPEPSTYALFGVGLFALGCYRRRAAAR
jgi:hypothetical protein